LNDEVDETCRKTPEAFANFSPWVASTLGSRRPTGRNAESVGDSDDAFHGSPTLSAFQLFSLRAYPGLKQSWAAISERLGRFA
jgi:hypothetical protein